MPLIPRHMLQGVRRGAIRSKVFVDLGLVSASSSYARGQRKQRAQPDGIYYLGAGQRRPDTRS